MLSGGCVTSPCEDLGAAAAYPQPPVSAFDPRHDILRTFSNIAKHAVQAVWNKPRPHNSNSIALVKEGIVRFQPNQANI